MLREDYEPYAPLDEPKPVAPDVWIVDGPEIRMRWLFASVPFPTRMTVIRLPDGGLWVHSPTQPSPALFDAVDALGPVRFLIAPNTIHYWSIPDWAERYPEAEVWAAPGTAATAKRPLPLCRDLGDAPPEVWAGTIDQVLVPGDLVTEVDFLHRPSRTLILADLIENFELDRVRPLWMRLALRVFGGADPDGCAPVDLRLTFWRHRRTVAAAARRMIDWAPERIVLAHGRCYGRDAVAELRRGLRWAL